MKHDKWWLKKEEKRNPSKRSIEAKSKKNKLRGKLVWCSAELVQARDKENGEIIPGRFVKRIVQGTYVRAVHGRL